MWTQVTKSSKYLHLLSCSILFLSEILVGVTSSSILTNEPFGWRQILGSSLIIIGGILAVVLSPKENVSK